MGDKRNAYNTSTLVGELEMKSSFRRPRGRWDYNIRMDLRESGKMRAGCIWLRIGISDGFL
jgi:hypothetical protein